MTVNADYGSAIATLRRYAYSRDRVIDRERDHTS